MNYFPADFDRTFDLAGFEQKHRPGNITAQPADGMSDEYLSDEVFAARPDTTDQADKNQFTIFQLSDGQQRVLNTTDIQPQLKGAAETPDVNISLDFESFRLSETDKADPDTRATLQLTIGQEQRFNAMDKLFYCINGGLDLWNQYQGNGKKTKPDEFRQSADTAMGNKPVALPGGQGKLTFNVVRHPKAEWWQQLFRFAGSEQGKQVLSLVGFGGITQAAVKQVSQMLEMVLDKNKPEILFSSIPIRLAFTQSAREDMSGGMSSSHVSCLNPGFWILARVEDYKKIVEQKPIYYNGYGILAPEGLDETGALDNASNPFSKFTYAVIRAKVKETSLKIF